MAKYAVNRVGHCPYCESSTFSPLMTEERRPGQKLMQCSQCQKWSIRQRGTQFPLQDPTDKESSPATSARD